MYIESEVLELKEKYTDNIIKDFVLFLNTNGGEIYVGIKDNGEILGIPKEISKEDFFNGVSHPRNSVLMRIFLKLGIVEHTGHGVPKIIAKYGRQAFDIHDSYINVVIPFNKKVLETLDPYKNKTNNNENSDDLSDKEKRVLMELVNNPKIAYQELVDDLSVSRRTISRIFESLTNKEYIQRIGTNKTGYWKVLK